VAGKFLDYRRGLQRLYVVLAVAWFLLVLFQVASDHWVREPWRITPSTWSEMAKRYGAVEAAPGTKADFAVTVSPLRKATWIIWLSLPIPVVGYVLLFEVSRWVYHGFRSSVRA
jgi:hypothetical protein